jgi:sucrose phosphorylase
LHGLLRNDSTHLQKWARSLDEPPGEATYLNFTASHDGIGVRPLEGLVPVQEVAWLVEQVRAREGLVSVRSLPDGSEQPYELNITYRDALRDPENDEHSLHRFMCSQCLMMSLRGIPAIYFQSVVGARNWTAGPEREGGEHRDINRQRWQWQDLEEKLDDPEGSEAWILNIYTSMLRARAQCPAFHPDASQEILETGGEFLGLVRKSLCGAYTVACFFNFTANEIAINRKLLENALGTAGACRNLLCALTRIEVDACRLGPYECAWIVRS